MKVGDLVIRAYAFQDDHLYGIIVALQPPPTIGNVSYAHDGFVVLWPDGATTYESEFELDPADWNQR